MSNYFDTKRDFRDFYASQAEAFLRHCWQRFSPATHLFLKNPELSLVLEETAELLPYAKFVIAVRDPRDQVVSEFETVQRQIQQGTRTADTTAGDFESLANTYVCYYAPILRLLPRRDYRFHFVRYEDLLLRPAATLDRLTSFTGLDFSHFDPHDAWPRDAIDWNACKDSPSMTPLYGQPVDTTRVGRYQRELTASQVRTVERICQFHLEAFGYTGAQDWQERLPRFVRSPADCQYVPPRGQAA